MIHFKLICHEAHEFDGWFRTNSDFEEQQKMGFLTCPACGSEQVDKMLMTPALSTSKKKVGIGLDRDVQKMMETIRSFSRKIREKADYVGDQFSDEARKMQFGEIKQRAIYGEATREEVKSLLDDGIDVIALPELQEDKN